MKITCPNCDTSYDIGLTSVGPEGRSVRCSRCSEEWYIDSEGNAIPAPLEDAPDEDDEWAAAFDSEEDEDPAPSNEDEWKAEIGLADDEGSSEDALAGKSGSETDDDSPVIDSAPAGFDEDAIDSETDEEETLRRRAKKRSAYDSKMRVTPEVRALLGLSLFLSSIVLCVAVVLMREPIVRAAPSMASLYRIVGLDVNLRGLEFRDLRTFQEFENGGVVLIVEGMIENVQRRSTHVPAVQLALRSSDAQEIYTWTIEPRVRRLPAGQNLRFSTRVASPPKISADVHVNFIDRNKNRPNL